MVALNVALVTPRPGTARLVSGEVQVAGNPLKLEQRVSYATYLGGGGFDQATGIAVDGAGNAYVTGFTDGGFPVHQAAQGSYGGDTDAFVVKLDPGGQVVYATYLGGSGHDRANGIAVDSAGNAYVAGITAGGFPVQNASQGVYGGSGDAFVAKLDPNGRPIYASYLGGGRLDQANGITVDGAGNAYITGITLGEFPVQDATQPLFGGVYDAFVVKLDASGRVMYATYLGGPDFDYATGIAVDDSGSAYVTGFTAGGFPVKNGAQSVFAGGVHDAFVAKLSGNGHLLWATYLGGGGFDQATGIAIDRDGILYVTGYTDGYFPVRNAAQPTYGGGGFDTFVASLNASGEVISATYLGGADFNQATGIGVDVNRNVYVCGFTSGSFPVQNAAQPTFGGGSIDAFVAKLSVTGAPAN
jgi:hypothetical protein